MDGAGVVARKATVLVDGLAFPESPRWHAGKLWYVDLPRHSLRQVDLDGRDELIEEFDHRPSAVEFLPDGTPLVAFADTLQVIRLSDHSLYADLSYLRTVGAPFHELLDMVVDGRGRLFISCAMPGRDLSRPGEDLGDAIAVVQPGGEVRVATDGVYSPNGLAITPDGRRLVVAEPLLSRLAAYSITGDGSLSDRQVFAKLDGSVPDGICADAEGAIWASGLYSGRAVRVHEGGTVSDSVTVGDGRLTIATMLGGSDRHHLFIASCQLPKARKLDSWDAVCSATGFIEVVTVEVPGGGWPANSV
jgi:sugar lactone lactonase YvrE